MHSEKEEQLRVLNEQVQQLQIDNHDLQTQLQAARDAASEAVREVVGEIDHKTKQIKSLEDDVFHSTLSYQKLQEESDLLNH